MFDERSQLWNPLHERLQGLDIGLIGEFLDLLKAKLDVDRGNYLLAQETNVAIAVAASLPHFGQNRIEGVDLLGSLLLSWAQVGALEIVGDVQKHLQSLLQLLVRFDGLNIEIRLLLNEEGHHVVEVFIFTARQEGQVSALGLLFELRVAVLVQDEGQSLVLILKFEVAVRVFGGISRNEGLIQL